MKIKIFHQTIRDKSFSKTKHINHVLRRVIFSKNKDIASAPTEMNTEVIIISGGGLVLPYFKNSQDRWQVVFVSQFRPAVKTRTVEAPGGRLDSDPLEIALGRELLEETGIKVEPSSIEIVVCEYTHPSILNTKFIGGIVKINPRMVNTKKYHGNGHENEWTRVETFDLIEILKKRDNNLIVIDLMTSRLLDEVAKTVGLLVRKY